MRINNTTDYILSGPMKFAGYTFLATGLIFVFNNSVIAGILISFISLFFTFSFSGVEIDTDNKRIKQYNKIFGIFKTGQWKRLDAYIGLTLVPMRRVNTIASRANLTNTTIKKDYRIFLVNKAKKPAIAIKVCNNMENAQTSLDEFSIWLKLPVYSIKR